MQPFPLDCRLLHSLCQREVHPAEHDKNGKPIEICWLFAEHGHAPEDTRPDSEVVEKREACGPHDPDRLEEQNVECGIYRHHGSQRPEPGRTAIRLATDLSKAEASTSIMARNALIVLDAATISPGIKLTATGNPALRRDRHVRATRLACHRQHLQRSNWTRSL